MKRYFLFLLIMLPLIGFSSLKIGGFGEELNTSNMDLKEAVDSRLKPKKKVQKSLVTKKKTYKSETKSSIRDFPKDTSFVFLSGFQIYRNVFKANKSRDEVYKMYLQNNTYKAGSRSKYWGNYDAITIGYTFGKYYNSKQFIDFGFVSNRKNRIRNSTLHLPEFLAISMSVATLGKNETYLQGGIPKTLALSFEALQPILRKEKSFEYYDILSIGAQAKLFNNSDFTSRCLMPEVSLSLPYKYINNFMLTYGYNFHISGKKLLEANYGHTFTLRYMIPYF